MSAQPAASAKKKDAKGVILCVDDEPSILSSLRRLLTSRGFEVHTAESGEEGLELLSQAKYDIIISDMRMPQMDGAEFLSRSIELQANAKRILLTGYADNKSTVRAINQGKVDFYLTKPWENDELFSTLDQCMELRQKDSKEKLARLKLQKAAMQLRKKTLDLEQEKRGLEDEVAQIHQEIGARDTYLDLAKDELQQGFQTTIRVFGSIMSKRLGIPVETFGKIHDQAIRLLHHYPLDSKLMCKLSAELGNAALLFPLGKLTFPDELIKTPFNRLNPEQRRQYNSFPVIGEELLTPLEPLSYAAKLIRHQNEQIDGQGGPDRLNNRAIPIGARILKVVVDFHLLQLGQLTSNPLSNEEALVYLRNHAGTYYDREVLGHLADDILSHERQSSDHNLSVTSDQLVTGMQLAVDVIGEDGMLLLTRDTIFTATLIRKLQKYESRNRVTLTYRIHPQKDEQAS